MAFLHLHHFDSAEIRPEAVVNRRDDLEYLTGGFASYFDAIRSLELDHTARWIVAVTGDKGMGKSILAHRLIAELRQKYSGDTVFARVDCRSRGGVRDLLAGIASSIVDEVKDLQVGDELVHAARFLSTIAHADEAASKVIHERLRSTEAASKLGLGLMAKRANHCLLDPTAKWLLGSDVAAR